MQEIKGARPAKHAFFIPRIIDMARKLEVNQAAMLKIIPPENKDIILLEDKTPQKSVLHPLLVVRSA